MLPAPRSLSPQPLTPEEISLSPLLAASGAEGLASAARGAASLVRASPAPVRPRGLLALDVSFAALQALDAVTTIRALGRGGVEANPVLGGVAGNPAALIAVKTSVAVGTVYLSERLWKRNRRAALALMVALNGTYAAIVAHNYRGRIFP